MLSGWTPAIDLYEDKDNLYVKAELPGMKREEIEVSLHEGTLSISGERKSETQVSRRPRSIAPSGSSGGSSGRVTLPMPVAADKVKAQYKDGVLSITLPKTEEAKPKQINVHVS